jgi:hypothetical protein
MRSLGLVALVALAGCDLYFTDGGDDDCTFPAADIAPQSFRNPDTGLCEDFGGFPCDPGCGPCPDVATLTIAVPDWGACLSHCESLDENSCLGEPGCRAIYDANSTIDQPPRFFACWATAPSGPAPGGCEGLDAYECSRHDNCSAYYDTHPEIDAPHPVLTFSSCQAEAIQGCYGDQDCGDGAHCSTSEGECLPPPGCGDGQGCPAVCYGRCISDADICAVALCEAGTHCEAKCTENGCHPVCVPDVPSCAAVDCAPGFQCVETCNGVDPNNPGCGICEPSCVPVGTCESLADEPTCAGRSDCRAVYTGEDCTCYSNGTCECQTLTYASCETK